jgi:hypothetical protein
MAGEPSNAASEFLRAAFAALNEAKSPPEDGWIRAGMSDDFSFEDRRRGPTFPATGADANVRTIASAWEVGGGQPRWSLREVVAVRGERFAACRIEIDYGDGMISPRILVVGLDPTMRLMQRSTTFDHEDMAEALAELDRLHSQGPVPS